MKTIEKCEQLTDQTHDRRLLLFTVLAIVVLCSHWFSDRSATNEQLQSIRPTQTLPAWPTHHNGKRLTQMKLSAQEKQWLGNFPGKVARFSDGRGQIILRWVTTPTRRLHPAVDCFRGLGYKIEKIQIVKDASGNWRRFVASKGKLRLSVRERISDKNNRLFTDTSEWYWSALMKKSKGPWMVVTEARQI